MDYSKFYFGAVDAAIFDDDGEVIEAHQYGLYQGEEKDALSVKFEHFTNAQTSAWDRFVAARAEKAARDHGFFNAAQMSEAADRYRLYLDRIASPHGEKSTAEEAVAALVREEYGVILSAWFFETAYCLSGR